MKTITERDVNQILEGSSENLSLEFKDSFSFAGNAWARERLIRSLLAMSNTRDGGYIVVGIKEKSDKTYDFAGMENDHFLDFQSKLEELKSKVESFSSSPLNYEILTGNRGAARFIFINVREFMLHPLICRKNGEHVDKILEEGAIYVRTLKDKPSSVKLVNPVDIQDFLERTTDKQIANLHRRGWTHDTEKKRVASDKSQFEKERADF